MFNLGPAEIGFILVVALLLLGPQRLPELARGFGKFFYEFRRQTDEVRGMVEREFYRMEQGERSARSGPEGAVPRHAPGTDAAGEAAPSEPPERVP